MKPRLLSMDRLEGSSQIKALFEKSIEVPEEIARVRSIFEDLLWDYNVHFVHTDVCGVYSVEVGWRLMKGLWPVNYVELCYVLFVMSQCIFDSPSIESALGWVRDVGDYHWLIDQSEWRAACGTVEQAIRSAMAH